MLFSRNDANCNVYSHVCPVEMTQLNHSLQLLETELDCGFSKFRVMQFLFNVKIHYFIEGLLYNY